MSSDSHHYIPPACDSEPDEDRGQATTLVPGETLPSTKVSKKTPVSVSSDSGYSSFSKTSKASTFSKTSTSKTLKPIRTAPAASSTQNKANVAPRAKASPVASSSPSSKMPCTDSSCTDCRRARRTSQPPPAFSQTRGRWVPTSNTPSVHSAPSPQPPSTPISVPSQTNLAPNVAPGAPPPAAVPRRRPSAAPSPAPRPISIAAPGAPHAFAPSLPPVVQQHRPPSVLIQNPPLLPPPVTQPPPMAPPPRPPPRNTTAPAAAGTSGGTWVRTDYRDGHTSHPPPPDPPRPSIRHWQTDVSAAPGNHRASLYGQPQYTYDPDPSSSYQDPPPPQICNPAVHPPRSSSRAPAAYSNTSRRQSMSHDPGYFDIDPYRTIRRHRDSSTRRPTADYLQPTSHSETHYQGRSGRHGNFSAVVERTTPPTMHRQDKINRDVHEARTYQDFNDRRAGYDPDDELADLDTLRLEAPPSPQQRRTSQSRHIRSASRASSAISRTSTEAGTTRIAFVGNAVEISGDTDGRQFAMATGQDGRPTITFGSGSPSHRRERQYHPESVRSNASYAERAGRRTSLASSPPEGSVSSSVRNSLGHRESTARRHR